MLDYLIVNFYKPKTIIEQYSIQILNFSVKNKTKGPKTTYLAANIKKDVARLSVIITVSRN